MSRTTTSNPNLFTMMAAIWANLWNKLLTRSKTLKNPYRTYDGYYESFLDHSNRL